MSSITRLVTAFLIGAGAGLLMGSRTVKTHDWRTEWLIPAPLPTVYEAVTSRSAVRRWWPSMELMDEAGGVLPTPFVKAWLGRTQEARREAEQLRDEVLSAIRGRTTHEVLPFSGQTAGLIHDILPANEIVERMVTEAELALTRADGFRSPGA